MSTNKIKHIGIFTSGGDSPGMNAALYSIAKSAKVKGIKIIVTAKIVGIILDTFILIGK